MGPHCGAEHDALGLSVRPCRRGTSAAGSWSTRRPRRRLVGGAADPAQAERERHRVLQLRPVGVVAAQVAVDQRIDVDGVLDVVEAPGDDSLEGHRQREERVGDHAVAPVEDQLAVVAHEHLAVVEVVVLQRLGHAVRRELLGHVAHARDGVAEPLLDGGVLDQRGVPVGERGQPQVGHAGRQQRVDVGLHRAGDVGRALEDVVPPRQVALLGDHLAEPAAAVLHEHPAALGVIGDQRRHPVGHPPGQLRARRRPRAAGPAVFALKNTSPSAVGTRITVAHGRTWNWSIVAGPWPTCARRAARRPTPARRPARPGPPTAPPRRAVSRTAGRALLGIPGRAPPVRDHGTRWTAPSPYAARDT